MANVNTAQLRTILQGAHPGQLVIIHASVVLSLLNQYKTNAGSEAVVTAVTPGSNRPPIDLSAF